MGRKMVFDRTQVLAKRDVACSAKGCKRRDAGVPAGAAGARCGREPRDAGARGSVPCHEAIHGERTEGTHQV